MARYGKEGPDKVEKAMHERKHGTLKSGRSGKKVTSRKQAIAIGLSEARRAGGKVPKKSSSAAQRTARARRARTKKQPHDAARPAEPLVTGPHAAASAPRPRTRGGHTPPLRLSSRASDQ